MIAEKIESIFFTVLRDADTPLQGELNDDLILLESGLDSLGFAILVARLDEELGFDPFSEAEEAYYPRTYREFVAFYEKYQIGHT